MSALRDDEPHFELVEEAYAEVETEETPAEAEETDDDEED